MKTGKEVSYLNTSVGKLGFCHLGNNDLIIIEDDDGITKIYNRLEYETFLYRIGRINKLLEIN